MRRSDALGNALDALQNEGTAYPDVMAEYVGVIREEFGQAGEHFRRYRAEVGLPGPKKPA